MLDGSGNRSAVHSLLERDGNQQQRPHPVGGPEPDRRRTYCVHCHRSDRSVGQWKDGIDAADVDSAAGLQA